MSAFVVIAEVDENAEPSAEVIGPFPDDASARAWVDDNHEALQKYAFALIPAFGGYPSEINIASDDTATDPAEFLDSDFFDDDDDEEV